MSFVQSLYAAYRVVGFGALRAATLAGLCAGAAAGPPPPAATGFEGLWHAPDKSVIDLKPCPTAGRLCGYIHWSTDDGSDQANPTPALRKRPICGLLILELHRYDGTMWKDGWVYDPEQGKTYKAALRKRDGKLFLRGFVSAEVFGETETWTPAIDNKQRCTH